MSWQYEETEKLMQLYKNNTLLWDPDDPDHNNSGKKRKAVTEIAKTLNKRVSSVTEKIRGLRTMYRRMDKKIKTETLKKGTYTGHVWSGYEPLSFLSKVYVRKNEGSIDDSKSEMGDESMSDESNEESDSTTKVSLWRQCEILKLIELYKSHPELWDKEHGSYYRKGAKIQAIKQIAESLNKLAPEVQTKIKNLRTVFANTHHKVSTAIKKYGKFTGKLWYGYRKMAFLNKDSLDVCEKISTNITNNEDLDTTNNCSSEDEWCRDEIMQLIEMYKNSPALWDSRNKNYGRKLFRIETLEAFSRVLHKNRRNIEAKIRNLRTTFARTHKLYNSPEGFKGKKWFAYKSLLFLDGVIQGIKKPKLSENEEHEVKMELFSDESHHSTYSSASHNSYFNIEDCNINDEKGKIDNFDEKATEKGMKHIEGHTSQRSSLADEFTVFGNFVAQELRKLKDEHCLVEAKSEITNIIFNAQKNQMLNRSYDKSVNIGKDLPIDPLEIPITGRHTLAGRVPDQNSDIQDTHVMKDEEI
ncbi:uncharacterized protein LOC105382124 [Plutella xylostella]|uniref:uncharacterized protein LOC105382124 n=1 Tax=Plutella xylostella TaxID=51655 RepID=UPI0020327F7B|nr:uncharacterized protein LOC105382124 [Plutella xylostella]